MYQGCNGGIYRSEGVNNNGSRCCAAVLRAKPAASAGEQKAAQGAENEKIKRYSCFIDANRGCHKKEVCLINKRK